MHPIIKPNASRAAAGFSAISFSPVVTDPLDLDQGDYDPELEQLDMSLHAMRISSSDASSSEAPLNAERDAARPEHSGLGLHLTNIRSFKIVPKRTTSSKTTSSPDGVADIRLTPCPNPVGFLATTQNGRAENLKRKPLDSIEPHDKSRRLDNGWALAFTQANALMPFT